MPRQNPPKKKIVLGVTGIFGSGKTAVSNIFKSWGADCIDADKVAHRCLRRGRQAYKKTIQTFGKGILDKNKAIKRKKLAKIAFNNRRALLRLNRILHPPVIRIIKERIKSSRSRVIVLDAPLLLEAGLKTIIDKLVVVRITRSKQLERVKKRDGLKNKDVLSRTKSQIPQSRKIRLADFIIDNSGIIKQTEKQVEDVWKKLIK
jgi:dephospho-CoA kinase